METTKSILLDVHGCKETHKPEKLYHEEQKDHLLETEEIKKELQENDRIHLNKMSEKLLYY